MYYITNNTLNKFIINCIYKLLFNGTVYNSKHIEKASEALIGRYVMKTVYHRGKVSYYDDERGDEKLSQASIDASEAGQTLVECNSLFGIVSFFRTVPVDKRKVET